MNLLANKNYSDSYSLSSISWVLDDEIYHQQDSTVFGVNSHLHTEVAAEMSLVLDTTPNSLTSKKAGECVRKNKK